MPVIIDGGRSGNYRGNMPPQAREQRALEEAKLDVTLPAGAKSAAVTSVAAEIPENRKASASYRLGNIIIG